MDATPLPSPAAFVGLGTMGGPIAARLLGAGHRLVVHNRDRAKASALLSAGAAWADSPREAARAAGDGLVFVMVSDGRAVRSVVFGRRGVAAGARAGALVVNLSTIAPDESRAIGDRLRAKGLHYLEAPVGGSQEAARQGQLAVYAGGDPADLARAQPLLEKFASRVDLLGGVGLGSAMKLVNNLVTVTTVMLDAEAIALAEAMGLERERAVDLLLAGGGQSRMLANKRDAFVRREYPAQFKLSLAHKDLGLVARAAREVGAPVRLSREARRLAEQAIDDGLAEQDFAAVYEAVRRRRDGAAAPAASGGAAIPPGP